MAASGSVVRAPSGVSAQWSGIGRPARLSQRIIPLPDWVSAMSRTMGSRPPARGTAMPQGFVPRTGRVAPHGAISAPAFVIEMPTSPASAARFAWKPAIPKWLLCRTPTIATPTRRAISSARSMARRAATYPSPLFASRSAAAGRSRTHLIRASGTIPPLRMRRAYRNSFSSPWCCPGCHQSDAVTTPSALMRASSPFAPSARSTSSANPRTEGSRNRSTATRSSRW